MKQNLQISNEKQSKFLSKKIKRSSLKTKNKKKGFRLPNIQKHKKHSIFTKYKTDPNRRSTEENHMSKNFKKILKRTFKRIKNKETYQLNKIIFEIKNKKDMVDQKDERNQYLKNLNLLSKENSKNFYLSKMYRKLTKKKINRSVFGIKYKIIRQLGKGSSSVVYLCQHQKSKQLFCVKILSKEKLRAKNLMGVVYVNK